MANPLTPQELAQQDQALALASKTLGKLTGQARAGLAEDTRSEVAHTLAVEITAALSPHFQTMILVAAILEAAEVGDA